MPVKHGSCPLSGKPRVGIISRFETQKAIAATHCLESQGSIISRSLTAKQRHNSHSLSRSQGHQGGMQHKLRLGPYQHLPRHMEMEQDIPKLYALCQTRTGIDTEIFVEIYHSLHSFNWHTHRFKAILTLNSKLSLCTAKSINANNILIQCCSRILNKVIAVPIFLCISAKEHQHVTLAFDMTRTHFLIAHI